MPCPQFSLQPDNRSDSIAYLTFSLITFNLALQTMIDRVIARTDLEFDMSICKTFGAKPQGGSLVKINNEFTNRWRVFCPIPKARRIKDTLPSSIHPYAKHLSGRVVDYKEKGSSVAYELPAFFEKLDVAPEFLTTEFETNI